MGPGFCTPRRLPILRTGLPLPFRFPLPFARPLVLRFTIRRIILNKIQEPPSHPATPPRWLAGTLFISSPEAFRVVARHDRVPRGCRMSHRVHDPVHPSRGAGSVHLWNILYHGPPQKIEVFRKHVLVAHLPLRVGRLVRRVQSLPHSPLPVSSAKPVPPYPGRVSGCQELALDAPPTAMPWRCRFPPRREWPPDRPLLAWLPRVVSVLPLHYQPLP